MAIRIDGGAAKASAGPSAVRVQRVEKDSLLIARMLSEKIGGCNTHYVHNRSRYCAGDDCPSTYHRSETVWKGYVAAEIWRRATDDWLPVVLELTEHVELDMRDVYARGQLWELRRGKDIGKKHSPVVASLMSSTDPTSLRPAFDITRVLVHLFHVNELRLDVANPLPPRLMLAPTPGKPQPPERKTA